MDAAIRTEDLRKVYTVAGSKWLRSAGNVAFVGGPSGLPARPGNGAPGEIVALQGLKLEVSKGEFFGLLGPNGAGKTTTIGILTTRVRPTAGRAFVAGADVVKEEVLVKQRIGVVPQRPNPDRSLNVRENLVFHAAYFGIGRSDAIARANELLQRLDIADRADSKVDRLSGGQQQRLMIARALIHEPEVLFSTSPLSAWTRRRA